MDESTDISVIKYLGIAAIYYSTFQNKIVTTFFGLEELVECNAAAIVKAILNALKSYELDIKNVIGIGTDNASVMVGINNGVHKILKEKKSTVNSYSLCMSLLTASHILCLQRNYASESGVSYFRNLQLVQQIYFKTTSI